MKILNKQYILDKPSNLIADYIEDEILQSGYKPLRWAIVKANGDKIIVDSTVIEN